MNSESVTMSQFMVCEPTLESISFTMFVMGRLFMMR